MKRNFIFAIVFLQTLILPLMAQTVLTRAANGMRVGDIVTLKQLDTISAGNAGANQVWDYSKATIEGNFIINYHADSAQLKTQGSAFIANDENGERNSYFQLTSTQSLSSGLKSSGATIFFDKPLVEMSYPFAYGSSIKGEMTGTYTENKLTVPINGTYEVTADAWGILILPSGVKLENVIRVRSVRDYEQEFSGSMYHIVVTRYAFYSPTSRYAVLQIKEVDSKCNCGCHSKEFKAYFNSSVTGSSEQKTESSGNPKLTYKVYPNPFQGDLNIDYTIEASAKMKISIVDMMGKELKTLVNKTQEEGTYNIMENMSAYHTSNFVLRIQVNDILYTEKLIKKESGGKK